MQRKCADTIGTVLVPGLAISNDLNMFFSNQSINYQSFYSLIKYKRNVRKKFYQTALGGNSDSFSRFLALYKFVCMYL